MIEATKHGFKVKANEIKFTVDTVAFLYSKAKTASLYKNTKTGVFRGAFSHNIDTGMIGNGTASDAWTDEVCVFKCIKGQITIGSAQILRNLTNA